MARFRKLRKGIPYDKQESGHTVAPPLWSGRAEQLCWQESDCAATRFQDIAARHFLHRDHTHSLVTRRERAAEAGIRIGSRVSFIFEGHELTGRVNRITKRATVLVQDPEGSQFSDGSRYKTYYVPLVHLKISESHGTPVSMGNQK